jgi:multidrug resistance efflux pump
MAEQENTQVNTPTAEAPKKSRLPLMVAAAIVLIIGGGIGAAGYLAVADTRVSIDKSVVQAPQIALAPSTPGILKQVFVKEGDTIPADTVVAQVGTELIKSTVSGLVIQTDTDIGAQVSAQTPVVTMIDPSALHVVGQIDENKGLTSLKVGDRAVFTVDAFGGKKFTGVVDEISPTSNADDVVFSISDKRATNTFNVKVAYDESAYPELKNGMSARLWIYK